MRIEVKKLNALKKYTGDFGFDYEPAADACLIPLCGIDGKVHIKGSYEIYDDDCVGVNFTVSYRLKGQCSYCLSDAVKDIEQSFDILFVPEEDSENYSYDGNSIDLTTAVNDAILFSQPNILLCREDCAGIAENNK